MIDADELSVGALTPPEIYYITQSDPKCTGVEETLNDCSITNINPERRTSAENLLSVNCTGEC